MHGSLCLAVVLLTSWRLVAAEAPPAAVPDAVRDQLNRIEEMFRNRAYGLAYGKRRHWRQRGSW